MQTEISVLGDASIGLRGPPRQQNSGSLCCRNAPRSLRSPAPHETTSRLGVSVATVRTHHSIYGKLGLESRVELALSSRAAPAAG